jgi:hypothetical protein
MLRVCAEYLAAGSDSDVMISTGFGLVAKFELLGIPPEVSVERERDEVFVNECRFYQCPGEPPGAVGGAGASCSTERAAIGRRENEQRLVLRHRFLARLCHVRQPVDLSPGTLAWLWLDHV